MTAWRYSKRAGFVRSRRKNVRQKKLRAGAMLDDVVLKYLLSKKMVTHDAKPRVVHLIRKKPDLSERRACDLVGVARRLVRY